MIVYGDPSFQESMAVLVARLEKSLSAADPLSLDSLRAVLIEAGMLEQAVEDALPTHAGPCRALTDRVAEAFVGLWSGRGVRVPEADGASALQSETRLTVKVPEGFAFYTLYPEAYVESVRRWRADHPDAEPLVVGVRSIGTTLSAVVAATLRAEGLDARRLTLRPTGHPFAREACLDDFRGATHVLVVDEGPGLSGSSMAAVAEAAHRAGVPRDRIAFLPGHDGEPGSMASAATQAWWRDVPRYVTQTESLRWEGLTLEEALVARTEGGISVEELTGGRWRDLVYRNEAEWPPIDAPFERRKLLVRRADGTAVLWKFVGLVDPPSLLGGSAEGGDAKVSGPSAGVASQVERGRGEGKTLGFCSSPWIEGEPLTPEDATPDLLATIGRHIATSAGPPLSPEEAQAAQDRLAEMARHNTDEAFGGTPTLPSTWEATPEEETNLLASPPSADPLKGEGSFCATDDRLAPWEWRRLPDGRVVKASRPAPTGDHTVVGRQPIEWAVAAATVEWNLDERSVEPLLGAMNVPLDREALSFYRAAYAAFRLGMTVCSMAGADPKERERLIRAEARYRAALVESLREESFSP